MFNIFKKIIKTGVVTRKNPFQEPPKKHRGKILVNENLCNSCGTCVDVCPANAISLLEKANDELLAFDYSQCMYCGLCVEECPVEALEQSNVIKESVIDRKDLMETFIISNEQSTTKEE